MIRNGVQEDRSVGVTGSLAAPAKVHCKSEIESFRKQRAFPDSVTPELRSTLLWQNCPDFHDPVFR